jgi:hypothetical protein
MTKNICKIGASVVVATMLMVGQHAWAQPDPNEPAKAENPPENNRQPRGQGGQGGRNFQAGRDQMENGMRQMLQRAGVNDKAIQDVILEYVRTDFAARGQLREQGNRLWQAVRNEGVTDEQLLALITDYRAGQEAETARRKKAEADLDEKVHYTKNPKLEAMLLLGGLIGEVSGPTIMYGGGFGGGGGGRGGQNNAFGMGGNQGGGGQGAQGGQNGGNRREQMQQMMLQRFDANKDGKLDAAEEEVARKWREERRQNRNNNQNNNAAQPPQPQAAPAVPPAEPAAEMPKQ